MSVLNFALDEKLSRVFSRLGHRVGQHPRWFLVVPLFVVALLANGFQRITFVKDYEKLYMPASARCFEERAIMESFFPTNYSDFLPDRATRFGRHVSVLIYAADEGSIIRQQIFSGIVEIHEALTQNLTIRDDFEGEGKAYGWQDLCSKYQGSCFDNAVIRLADAIQGIDNGTSSIAYPFTSHPRTGEVIILAGSLANPVLDQDDLIVETKAVQLQYFLDSGSPLNIARSFKWEKAAVALLRELNSTCHFSNLSIFYNAESTLEDDTDALLMEHGLPMLGVTGILTVVVAALCCWSPVWRESRMMYGVAGAALAGMGCLAGMGLLFFCGWPMGSGAMGTPFLIFGVGMDDCFVLLAFWRHSNPSDPVPKRLADTYGAAAVSITITSLTNATCFVIQALTAIKMGAIFSVHTVMSMVAVYILAITMLGAILALYAEREANLTLQEDLDHSTSAKTEDKSWMKQLQNLFGFSFDDEGSRQYGSSSLIINVVNLSSIISRGRTADDFVKMEDNGKVAEEKYPFCRFLSRILSRKTTKIAVAIGVVLYWAVGIVGLLGMKQGGGFGGMVAYTSAYAQFFERQSRDFMDFAVRIPVILVGGYNFSDPQVQQEVEMITERIEGSYEKIAGDMYTDSWLRGFLEFVEREKELGVSEQDLDILNEANFTRVLKKEFLTDDNIYARDVVFGDDGKIIASRFVFQARHLENVEESRHLMEAFRSLFDNDLKKYNLTSYHPLYQFGEQFLTCRRDVIVSVGAAIVLMMVASFLLLPDWRSAIWTGVAVFSIELGIFGFSSFAGVSLDAMSSGIFLICVGFSVDFCAHVSHSYLHSKAATANGRIYDALSEVGSPVMQSALSTFVAIAPLSLLPSYSFQVFFICISLVIVFGIIHGLIILPVVLSLFTSRTPLEEDNPKADEASTPSWSNSPIVEEKNEGPVEEILRLSIQRHPDQRRRRSVPVYACKNFAYSQSEMRNF